MNTLPSTHPASLRLSAADAARLAPAFLRKHSLLAACIAFVTTLGICLAAFAAMVINGIPAQLVGGV